MKKVKGPALRFALGRATRQVNMNLLMCPRSQHLGTQFEMIRDVLYRFRETGA